MTILRTSSIRRDPSRLAAAARSILSCPTEVGLVVDGVPVEPDSLQDRGGEPTFVGPVGSPLSRAAEQGSTAVLTLRSGLGRPGAPERDAVLTLTGRLAAREQEECGCCAESCDVAVLVVEEVALSRVDQPAEQPLLVPVEHFRSPGHHLNRGYLQRSVEHANDHHQEDLRRAVAATTGAPLGEVLGVALADLRPDRVEVRWVGLEGADSAVLAFPRAARTPAELGEMLRRQLRHDIC